MWTMFNLLKWEFKLNSMSQLSSSFERCELCSFWSICSVGNSSSIWWVSYVVYLEILIIFILMNQLFSLFLQLLQQFICISCSFEPALIIKKHFYFPIELVFFRFLEHCLIRLISDKSSFASKPAFGWKKHKKVDKFLL